MGCGANSKVLPGQPEKEKNTQNKTAENTLPNSKNKQYTISLKNNNQNQSDQEESDAVGGISHRQGATSKPSKLRQSGSLSLSIIKQNGAQLSQQQQIIQPKLNKQNSISVRKVAGGHRASIELSELLGKSIPIQNANSYGSITQMNNNANNNQSNFSKANTQNFNNSGVIDTSVQDNNVVAVERKQRKELVVNNRLNEQEEAHTEQYVRMDRKPTNEEIQFVIDSLSNNSVFYSLEEEQVAEVVEKMFLCSTSKGSYLFKQGDKATAFFVIKSGKIGIEINAQEKKELSVGIGIGELALLYSAPRSASVKCKTDCQFWGIDRKTFRKTVEEIVQRDSMTNRKFMESVPFFSFMSDEQKDSIASALISVRFKAGDTIVAEGDRADSFYLIKEGKVSVWKDNNLLRNLYQNDSFGEQALYVQSTRAASVKADEEVKLLSLGRDDLTRILGGKIQKIVYANKQRWTYNNNELLLKLTKIQIEKLLMNTKIQSYKSGTMLFEAGDYCDSLIAVIDGNLKSGSSNEVLADRGQIFGDKYLPGSNQNIKLDEQVIVGSDAVLSIISFKQFHKCIGGEINSVIKKNANSHEVQMKQERMRVDYSDMKLEDLIYIKKLGEGQFGSVYLVRRKHTKELYALKSVSKAQIIQQSLEKHLMSEKNVLQLIEFPFIMPFIRTFKDEQSVYFLLKFISRMELFDVIRDIGLLSTFDAQFYTSSLILSLEYLHSKSIIYRDIKPENIMVDHTGYLFLIDMGAAKLLNLNNSKKTVAKTFTIIGTPHYMAPEIIKGKGYTYSADLWSVGICLYEFMCGMVPYAEEASDPYEIYEEINNQQLKFPGFLKDRKAKLFMEQLLQKQPELRLGGSYAALKTNPWFDSFEWDALYNKTIQPPFLPPPEKLLTQELIEGKFKENKQIIVKIKQEQEISKLKYNKALAKDPEWDKTF